ncbi:MAG: PIN/TRAM domain-containing protein, partial [Firmicutes bacterium]|nr:PIN/TRAM domain-containing protein [Bacillota bacterium]
AAILMVGTYLLFGYLGIVIGRKYISQIAFFSTKLPTGTQVIVLDTSAIIDGRILELSKINFLQGKFVVANFVLNELRRIADSADSLKRNRGRRGLDIISSLQKEKNIDIEIFDTDFADVPDLDTKILKLASSLNASVLTTDFNLNKVANVLNVKVINLNELSNAVKPLALPGEKMTISIVKQGKDKAQGVGFLEDGTMVVVENGGDNVGQTLEVVVSTSLQTNAGRMIFTRIES